MEPQLPDSLWMRIFVTETEVEVELDDLVSDGVLVPHEETETEIEWEFLEGGEMFELEADVPEAGKSIVRRYEYLSTPALTVMSTSQLRRNGMELVISRRLPGLSSLPIWSRST